VRAWEEAHIILDMVEADITLDMERRNKLHGYGMNGKKKFV
jgi:hypothetical protein